MTEYSYIFNRIDNGIYENNLELFKVDLLITYGMLNRVEGKRCYEIAWKYGILNGLNGVLDLFHETVGLVNS